MGKWLEGKSAIVTGALGVMGRMSTEVLAREGAKVLATDPGPGVVQFAAEVSKKTGGQVTGQQCNPLDRAQLDAAVQAAQQKFGRIDILVCAYEENSLVPIAEMTEEQWHKVINANLRSVFYACRAVVPAMVKQRYGRVINFSAVEARVGSGLGEAHFATAKSAIIGFNHALAREVFSSGVTVNAILPGLMLDRFPGYPALEEIKQRFPAFAPQLAALLRPCKAEDLAGVLLLLASDQSAQITGDVLAVGGGFYMTP